MALAIDRLRRQAADDADLLGRLVALINHAYVVAEEGLWLPGWERTDVAQTHAAVTAGRVVVAQLDGALAGTVWTLGGGGSDYSFGTLAVDAALSGRGIGSALVHRVEMDAAAAGAKSVRLEVMVSAPPLPHLDRLASWYSRLGYREVGRTTVREISPHEAPFLARACEASVMEKALAV